MNLLATTVGRRWLFALLYLSEGAPIGFVWWAMPTVLRSLGVELAAITTLTALATLPWVLKFLVAPLIDSTAAHGIPVKRWILVCQICMAIAILPLAALDWAAQFGLVMVFVVTHAMFAAAQDVGIDTLAIRTVPQHELGRVNGYMQAGMLAGRAGVAAGTTLLFSAFDSTGAAVWMLALLIVLPAITLKYGVTEPRSEIAPYKLRAVIRTVATRAGIAGMLVALLVGAGFEYFGVTAGPRLVDLGYSDSARALFFGLLAPAGLAAGALAGGTLTDRLGAYIGITTSLGLLTVLLLCVASIDRLPVFTDGHLVWFTATYFAIGMLTASSYTLFMTLSHGAYAATRVSLFMAMTNACEAWAAFVGGRLLAQGFGMSVATMALIACLALVPLYIVWQASARTQAAG